MEAVRGMGGGPPQAGWKSLFFLSCVFVSSVCLLPTRIAAQTRSVIQTLTLTPSQVTLGLSEPVEFAEGGLPPDPMQQRPARCYVDLFPAVLSAQIPAFQAGTHLQSGQTGRVQGVRTAQYQRDTARVVLDLFPAQTCSVRRLSKPERLQISVGPSGLSRPSGLSSSSRPQEQALLPRMQMYAAVVTSTTQVSDARPPFAAPADSVRSEWLPEGAEFAAEPAAQADRQELASVLPMTYTAEVIRKAPPLPAGFDTGMPHSPVDTQEPRLPAGLDTLDSIDSFSTDGEEPQLPMGLDESLIETAGDSLEPALPSGLGAGLSTATGRSPKRPGGWIPKGGEFAVDLAKVERDLAMAALFPPDENDWLDDLDNPQPVEVTGFVEVGQGVRTQDDPHEKRQSLAESRAHAELQWTASLATLRLSSDFIADWGGNQAGLDLETGEGWLDLREANIALSPLDFIDVKLGRQILTWGTGDLLFINDLFPKDWQAFFLGREESYLKAPSDALKASVFTPWANLDVVYTPQFDADRFITGRRISYWNPLLGRRAGRDARLAANRPNRWFHDDEWAARVYRNIAGYELAVYGNYSFWKSPGGFDATGQVTFPRLASYGASVHGPVWKGIGHGEFGYYDSLTDRSGSDPFVRNSEVRFLAGYEQEIGTDLTLGGQYALDHMLHYNRFRASHPDLDRAADENHHLLTLRLTKLLLQQNLGLSVFTYLSPNDLDVYLRPRISYKFTDAWSGTVGANLFVGKRQHTFFSQLAKNRNAYVRVRYSF